MITEFSLNETDVSTMVKTSKRCIEIANEIIEFAEKYELFNPELDKTEETHEEIKYTSEKVSIDNLVRILSAMAKFKM